MFHRFQIGEMAATIVSDGPLVLPAAAKIFRGPARRRWTPRVTAVGQRTDAVRVEQNCLLLETGGKRVLFDNGWVPRSCSDLTAASCWAAWARRASIPRRSTRWC